MKVLGNARRGFAILMLAALALAPASFAKKNKTANQQPVVWGMRSGNAGCVIFRETETTVSRNVGASFTMLAVNQLEVVESQHVTLPKKAYTETTPDIDALTRLAIADHLKYVKLPKKYTPEQLEKARAMCGTAH